MSRRIVNRRPMNRKKGGFPEPSVIITFDDAWKSQYNHAFPIMMDSKLEGFDCKPTIYTIPGVIGGTYPFYVPDEPQSAMMTENQLDELYDAGIILGNHTYSHDSLKRVTSPLAESDTNYRNRITELINNAVDWFEEKGYNEGKYHLAYPFGDWSEESITIEEECNILTARTINNDGQKDPRLNPYKLKNLLIYTGMNTASSIKSYIDYYHAKNQTIILTFHHILPTITGPSTITTLEFQNLINIFKDGNYKMQNIVEFWNEWQEYGNYPNIRF